MESLFSIIAKEYISNMSYLPKVLLQLVATEDGYWRPFGLMVGGGGGDKYFFVIS